MGRTIITFTVVFFLTFLGMRLSFLDKTSKPKPRPRAVLKFVGKTFGVAATILESSQTPSFDACCESRHFECVTRFEIAIPVYDLTPPALPLLSNLHSGRSPPLS